MAKNRGGKRSWLPTIVAVLAVFGIVGSCSADPDTEQPEEPQQAIEEYDQEEKLLKHPFDTEETPAETGSAVVAEPEPEPEPAAEPETPQPDTSASEAPAATPPETATPQSRTVYVTNTGKRYHYNSNCGNGRYYESTLDAAERSGLTPCKKCVR